MNLEILETIRELLGSVDPVKYGQSHPLFSDSSIGGHVRHIFEFYQVFLEGKDSRKVDYTSRKRNAAMERDPRAALLALNGILSQMRTVPDGPLSVISDSGESFSSSIGRELEFLAGHAVHHNAMIVALSQSLGVGVNPDMALAKSTLEYRKVSA